MCSTWLPTVLRADPELVARSPCWTVPGRAARARRLSRVGEPGRSAGAGATASRARRRRGPRRSPRDPSRPCVGLGAQLAGGVALGASRARYGRGWVIAWYASAAASSRAGVDEHGAADPAVVAGAVHALVVRRREQPDPSQRFGPVEDPLHVVDVQPHAFAVGGGERSGLVPHRARHAEAADVVDERGAADERRLGGREVQQRGRGLDEVGGAATVAGEVRAAQVAEVADRLERAVELVVGERRPFDRFGVEDLVDRVVVDAVEQRVGIGAHGVDDLRVEVRAAPRADHLDGVVDAADAVEHLARLGDVRDPRRQRRARRRPGRRARPCRPTARTTARCRRARRRRSPSRSASSPAAEQWLAICSTTPRPPVGHELRGLRGRG